MTRRNHQPIDITRELRADSVDSHELNHVLLHFYGLSSDHSSDEIIYTRTGDTNYALKLKYQGRNLISIETGPGYKVEDLQHLSTRIQTELLPQHTVIGRLILFSKYPVDRAYTAASNFFQILPVPSHAPRPSNPGIWGVGGHPFLLEFPFTDSPNALIKSERHRRVGSDLSLFLNAILKGTVTITGPQNRMRWVSVQDESTQSQTFQYCREGYHYHGFDLYGHSFTALETYAPMRKTPANSYYEQPSQVWGHPLELPDSIDSLVLKYFSLPKDERERFLRAAFWLYQSAGSTSSSTYFLNLIFAIDTLVPPETGRTSCPSCKQSVGKSLTGRFVEFLAQIVPAQPSDPEAQTVARRKLCRTRGDLAHGRELLSFDRNASTDRFDPAAISDMKLTIEAWALAKVALVNWLQRYPPVTS